MRVLLAFALICLSFGFTYTELIVNASEDELLTNDSILLINETEIKNIEADISNDTEETVTQLTVEAETSEVIDEAEEDKAKEHYELHPCSTHFCKEGKECVLDDEKVPYCRCAESCPKGTTEWVKVCSSHNVTYETACHLYQQRCFCEMGDSRCNDEMNRHSHVEYRGRCIALQPCLISEMEDFPRRMREWLFYAMKDQYDRNDLNEDYFEMEEEAEKYPKMRLVNPVIWKFCDLDDTGDVKVSRHELVKLKAPLVPLEHCIGPFLKNCDTDDDHMISLTEWGTCLGLEEDQILAKCKKYHHHFHQKKKASWVL